MADDDIRIQVSVETSDAVDELDAVADASRDAGTAVDDLDGDRATVTVEADTDQADRAIDTSSDRLDVLDGDTATVTLEAKTVALEQALDKLDSELDALDGRDVTIEVDADTTKAKAGLDGIGEAAGDAGDQVGSLAGEGVGQLGELAGATGPVSEGLSQITELALSGKVNMAALAKSGAALAGLAGLMYALDKRSKQAADRLDEVTAATERLSTVADGEVLGELQTALANNLLSGRDLRDLFREMAEQNPEGFARALDLAGQSGTISAEGLQLMRAALDDVKASAAQGKKTNEDYGTVLDDVTTAVEDTTGVLPAFAKGIGAVDKPLRDAYEAAKDLDDAVAGLLGRLSDRQAFINAQEAVEGFVNALADPESSTRDIERAWLDASDALVSFVSGLEGVPDSVVKQVLVQVEAGDIGAAYKTVDDYFKTRPVALNVTAAISQGIGAVLDPGQARGFGQPAAQVVTNTTVNNYYPPRMTDQQILAAIANSNRARGGV